MSDQPPAAGEGAAAANLPGTGAFAFVGRAAQNLPSLDWVLWRKGLR